MSFARFSTDDTAGVIRDMWRRNVYQHFPETFGGVAW